MKRNAVEDAKELARRQVEREELLRKCQAAGVPVEFKEESQMWQEKRARQAEDCRQVASGERTWKDMLCFDFDSVAKQIKILR